MRRLYYLSCTIFICLMSACKQDSGNFEKQVEISDASAPQSEAAPPPPPPPGEVSPKEVKDEANVEIKLIKTGTLEFETSDLGSTYQRIRNAAQTNAGFVSNESTANEYDRIVQHLTIRVPSRNFDPLVTAISKGVKHFDTKNIEAVDVTEEFVDAEARLKTKKQVEQRYQDLLKRANKISEILEIEKQIGELRAEIESIEGRLRYLSNRVDYSTLDIRFYKKVAEHRVVEENRFGRAFRNGWDGMVSFLIGLTSIWPFLIIFGVGGYFFWRRWRKK
ncbi:MAG: DUF4349 domain-containing protein [Haliscomenobacter sp.]|nr:DUF4349 domain-containing protein [Haliscomenobacter sp.]MBK9487563.1 DUF4349 domain-containing protein [Haliscomenobacter sp.]